MARKESKTWETEKAPFPSRLSEIMKERQVSQEKLAVALGVKRQTVSLYKTGQSSPNAEQLCKIANFFDISSDWLLGLSDVKGVDPDVRAVHELTGLSETALDLLIELRRVDLMSCCEGHANPIINTLNRLLSIESGKDVLFKMNRLGIFRDEYRISADSMIQELKSSIEKSDMSKNDAFPYVGDLRKELFSLEKNESYERFDLIDSFIKLLDRLYPIIKWEDYREICDELDGINSMGVDEL